MVTPLFGWGANDTRSVCHGDKWENEWRNEERGAGIDFIDFYLL
jgi:hypothetical protein